MFEEVAEIETQQTENQGFDYEAWIKQKLSENLMGEEEFHLRHSGATNQRWLKDKEVAVIGLGSIGGTMVQYLMDLGLEKIKLFDPDRYEVHNTAVQGNDLTDIGELKVEAVRKRMLKHTGVNIEAVPEKVEGTSFLDTHYSDCAPDIIIVGVDNMEMRNQFWQGLRQKLHQHYPGGVNTFLPELVFDCRMTLGTYTVISLPLRALLSQGEVGRTMETLDYIERENCFSDEEALQEDCAARSINYTVTHLASYVCAWIDFYSRNLNDYDVLMSVLNPRDAKSPFKLEHAFDVRNWSSITKSPSEYRMIDKNQKLMEEVDSLEKEVERLQQNVERLKDSTQAEEAEDQVKLGICEYMVTTEHGPIIGVIVEDDPEKIVMYRSGYYVKIMRNEILRVENRGELTDITGMSVYKNALPFKSIIPGVNVRLRAHSADDGVTLWLNGMGGVWLNFERFRFTDEDADEFLPEDIRQFNSLGRIYKAEVNFGESLFPHFEILTDFYTIFGAGEEQGDSAAVKVKDVNTGKIFEVLNVGTEDVLLEGESGQVHMARRTYERLTGNGTLQFI